MAPRRLIVCSCAVVFVLIAVLCMDTYGFSTHALFKQHIWDTVGALRLARYTGLFLAVAVPILLLVPWSFAGLVVGFVVLATAISVGPSPLYAVVLFLISSCTLGMKVLNLGETESWELHLLGTLTGVGLYISLMTLVARLPVNYPVVWASVLVAPVLLDWRAVRRRSACWLRLLRSTALRPWSQRGAAALFAFVIMMHWLVVLEPEKSADGLAVHLAIATNIATRHAFTFQPAVFVWAVMPMGADFAYSIVYLIGGEFGARLLNYAMLLLLAALLYGRLRRSTSLAVSLFLVAMFATTPLVQLVTGSLLVDNMMAVMILGAICALLQFGETGRKGFLYAVMVLGGTALAIKVGALSFLVLALPWLILEMVRHRKALRPRPLAACLFAVTLFLATGVPAYAIAWWKTGNPIFPFKNEKIHSLLLNPAMQFQDNEFRKSLTWTAPFDLAFHTHAYYEGQDGTLGFQYTFLLPLGFLTLLLVKSHRTSVSFLVAVGAAIVILKSEPNVRYLYPSMPLLFIPFAALLGWLKSNQRWLYGVVLSLAIPCSALNLYFLPGSSWYHKDFYMQSPFSQRGRDRYTREYVPIRTVLSHFNHVHPGAAIFLANDEDVADPEGDVYEGGWHQYSILEQLRKVPTLPAMARLFELWGVHYFASRKTEPGEHTDPEMLAAFLEKCTAEEYRLEPIRLTRLEPAACHAADPPPPAARGKQ